MQKKVGVLDRMAGLIIGCVFLVVGFVFALLGFTFLPILGIIAALAAWRISFHFLGLSVQASETGSERAREGEYRGLSSYPAAGAA